MTEAARRLLSADPEKLGREGVGLAALCAAIIAVLSLPVPY